MPVTVASAQAPLKPFSSERTSTLSSTENLPSVRGAIARASVRPRQQYGFAERLKHLDPARSHSGHVRQTQPRPAEASSGSDGRRHESAKKGREEPGWLHKWFVYLSIQPDASQFDTLSTKRQTHPPALRLSVHAASRSTLNGPSAQRATAIKAPRVQARPSSESTSESTFPSESKLGPYGPYTSTMLRRPSSLDPPKT
eukprot:scaffold100167_cov65-Phaeocystis_antarctica.AAC.6